MFKMPSYYHEAGEILLILACGSGNQFILDVGNALLIGNGVDKFAW